MGRVLEFKKQTEDKADKIHVSAVRAMGLDKTFGKTYEERKKAMEEQRKKDNAKVTRVYGLKR